MSRPLRPVWWREVALVAGTYGIYSLTRNTLPDHIERARRHAEDVLRLEQDLHLDVERSVNHTLATHAGGPLVVAASYIYATAHIWVALAVLCWLYVARPDVYRGARTVLLVTTWLSLLGFWLYPLAPPRLLPDQGFVDTVVREHVWGSWGSTTVERMSNQYAAMPSAHVAWSVWVAAVLVLYARRRLVRVVALAYPVLVSAVVVATANHWVLDVVAGVVTVGIALALCLSGRWARRRLRPAPPVADRAEDLGPLTPGQHRATLDV